ncbi:GTPase HflX [Candidatus Shikimatogenerans bostrichidophilus]|uniref:GTPase HflX n=1 Tax=Candidatus Shikimatogenerans bostrichidophilus TaxID=2943807 RepID=UPI002966AAEA
MYNKNILIGVFKNYKKNSVEYLNELENLLKVFNGKVKKKFLQRRLKPHNLTYVGKGFLKKVALYVKENLIDTVIFDDELTLSQIKNIEKEIKCIISDRTKLILDIFFYKAKTSYSKMQIKLGQYEYLLPRLTHMWSHLKRQKGGIGLRGPGEKEIETDRRLIKKSILILKRKINKLNYQLLIQRKRRKNKLSISLIGYTNVGKSTIISKLTNNQLVIDNKYFTTLDTKVNNYYFKNKKYLMVDTIGFIRKIPTTLIESFKSTLLEIKYSDLILHIVDISSNFVIEKILYIMNFLLKLKLINKNIIIVFNKIDKIKNFNLLYIKKLFKSKNKYLLFKNNYIYYIYKINNIIYKKKIKYILFTKINNIYINKLKEFILMVSAGFEPATS